MIVLNQLLLYLINSCPAGTVEHGGGSQGGSRNGFEKGIFIFCASSSRASRTKYTNSSKEVSRVFEVLGKVCIWWAGDRSESANPDTLVGSPIAPSPRIARAPRIPVYRPRFLRIHPFRTPKSAVDTSLAAPPPRELWIRCVNLG